jgi:endonuclease/exonuclease/phosphatase (EEP) superfamily protein YafD
VIAPAAALGLAAVTLFSFAAGDTWLGEITTHFRPHLALAALALLALAGLQRAWLGAALAAACLLANLAPLLPYLGTPAMAGEGVPFRVLTVNLHSDDADHDAVAALIERERPDVVALTEVGAATEALVERLRPLLPSVLRQERRGSFEVMLLTRWHAEGYRVDRSTHPNFPVSRVRLCDARCVNLVAVHAARPLDWRGAMRAGQLAVAARLASENAPSVLLGDLNCTPWSPAFADLLGEAGLRDSALGYGLRTTWLSALPFVGLPIDHVLASPGIGVRDRRVGPDVGSDHFPVIAELVLPAE